MVKQQQLTQYLNELLTPDQCVDYCPNGLQVAGKDHIKQVISGVSACQALLDAAVSKRADAIIVHHGYFWKNESPLVVGMKRQRLATLLQHDINLFAYHLPLDVHRQLGNNAQLAKLLDIEVTDQFAVHDVADLLWVGRSQINSGQAFAQHIADCLKRNPLYIPGEVDTFSRIAWCSGAAQDLIEQAIAHGADAYLTGEVSERTVHIARESGIHFYAAGHHATERYGIQALGEHLVDKFRVGHEFIEVDNPA